MQSSINSRRVRYAFELIRAANTVCVTTLDEMEDVVRRSLGGEFDRDVFKEDSIVEMSQNVIVLSPQKEIEALKAEQVKLRVAIIENYARADSPNSMYCIFCDACVDLPLEVGRTLVHQSCCVVPRCRAGE